VLNEKNCACFDIMLYFEKVQFIFSRYINIHFISFNEIVISFIDNFKLILTFTK